MEITNFKAFIIFPVSIFLLGTISSLFNVKKIPTWYKNLIKPKYNPPNWIFGPVWTILYIMIGNSGYFFWERKQIFSNEDTTAWIFFFIQLFLNAIWSPIFFGLNKILLAFFILILMDVFAFLNFYYFFEKSYLAGNLLIPYLLWISFATYLNFSIWVLNRGNNHQKIPAEEKENKKN